MQKKTLSSVMILGLTGALALAGCKKNDETVPAAVPSAEQAPASSDSTAAPAAVSVSAVSVGNSAAADKSVAPLTVFAAKDKIIVSIKTDGAASNVGVAAKLVYQDGQVAGEQHETLNTSGPETTNITFSNANPWPVGNYSVEVSVNGAAAGAPQHFEVK